MTKARIGIVAMLFFFGCGGSGAPETIGDACTELAEVWCEHARRCVSDPNTQAGCVNTLWRACCGDQGTCGNDPMVSGEEWDACLDDIPGLSCDDTLDGNLPSSCLAL